MKPRGNHRGSVGARAVLGALAVLSAAGCSQTPVVVPVRSMERPKDVDFICLKRTSEGHWRGAPLAKCQVDSRLSSVESDEYRLHALVTQMSRGELAVVDLARSPIDTTSTLVKVDPRLPGYSFLPIGAVPTDVAADPDGAAVFVASGHDARIDIVPAEMIRGPIDPTAENGDALPWPHLDLDPEADGVAASLTVVRDDRVGGVGARLIASLPEAAGGPKIAMWDLSKGALAPTRLLDVAIKTLPNSHVSVADANCTPGSATPSQPWWAGYESCFGGTLPTPKPPVQPTIDRVHPSGVAMVAGLLFAADDAAPVVHVVNLNGADATVSGAATYGAQWQIGVGSTTSRLAVSEVVPDEVTPRNAAAISVCEQLGWLGDGADHSADSEIVKTQLGGRCRAHRYVYAIDLIDAEGGDGSVLVIDVPIVFATALDPTDPDKKRTLTYEQVDPAAAEMAQPLACDAPSFPVRRVPLGPYGVGPGASVPVRAITFVKQDPLSAASARGVRCIPWALDGAPTGQQTAVPELDKAVNDPSLFGDTADKRAAYRAARRADEQSFTSTADARRLRGVFGFAALANGAIAIVDVDDYDGLCRGYGVSSSAETFGNVVQRHHARLSRKFTDDVIGVSSVTLASNGISLSTDPETAANHPHFVKFGALPDLASTTVGGAEIRQIVPQITLMPDSPLAIRSETWTATYEGELPGFQGAAGSLVVDQTAGTVTFADAAGHFCRRGAEASTATPDANDVVQIREAVCADASCAGTVTKQQCLDAFGAETDVPLKRSRDLLIGRAFEDRLTIAKHGVVGTDGAFSWAAFDANALKLYQQCFPALSRYAVRSNGTWLVIGGASGYLHRRIPSVEKDPTSECVVDTTKPRVIQGRATQFAALGKGETETPLTAETCKAAGGGPLFVNPAVAFAIRAGTDPSVRDMQFSFTIRNSATPLNLALGTLPTAIKQVGRFVSGVDQLGWQQIAVVDGIDKGLTVFSLADLSTSKNFP